MRSQGVSNIIQIFARPKLDLKPGDSVYIKVIKRLFKNKWAVSLKGKVFTAYSDLELNHGQKIKAFVDYKGNRLLLHVKEQESEYLVNIMKQMGVQDNLSKYILSGLLRSRIPVSQDILLKIKSYLHKKNKKSKQAARMAALLLKKNIDIKGDGIDSIMNLMDLNDKSFTNRQKEKNREKNNHKELIKTALKKQIGKTSNSGDNPLQLFNHLNGRDDNWIIFPYNFIIENTEYKGIIKILYDSYEKEIKKFVFSTDSDNKSEWSFFCTEKNKNTKISVFCNNKINDNFIKKNIIKLESALKHLNVNIQLHLDEDFDGFQPDWDDVFLKKINIIT